VIVLDASVVVELLTNGRLAGSLRRDLSARNDSFIVPHLLDVEVMSALLNLVARQGIDSHRAEQLLTGLTMLPAERYAHIPLLTRI
jgi:predicted nucleic acid-binding protein